MTSFLKLRRTALFYFALNFLLVSFPLIGHAQTIPEQVQIASHLEEELTILGECPDHPPGTYVVGWIIYLAWDMTPEAPFYDIHSPIGYWGTLGATSVPYPGLALPLNHHWRERLAWMNGCFQVEQTRQGYRDQNWRVSAEFYYPDGRVERKFSNVADFDGRPELMPRSKLVPIERMSLTKDPINIATGEMIIQAKDFSFDGRGPALELARTYRSQSNVSGLFGYGWHSAYDRNLTEDVVGNVRILNEQGGGRYFNKREDGSYEPSPGSYASLAKDESGMFLVTDKHGTTTVYDLNGRLSSITERNGNALRFIFDPSVTGGTYIEDAGGRKITLTLDASGRIIAAEDPAGRIVQYAYDALGNLVMITNPDGQPAMYEYNTAHNIMTVTNVNGHRTYFAYDSSDRAVRNWQEGDVNKTTLTYPGPGGTYVTDALGHRSDYYYNQFGLTTQMVDALGKTHRTGWDSDMNRISTTGARGNTTTFEYDGRGNLITVTDALGARTAYTYTGDFNLISSKTDALGHVNSFEYDAHGNPLAVTDALGHQTLMAYDAFGDLLSSTDALGHTTRFAYDPYGQIARITDALDHETLLTYDSAGNNITTTDANDHTTAYDYDVLNRLVTVHFADGTTESYAYDAFGNRTGVTDQKGRVATDVYDAYERLVQTTDALGQSTFYTYDNEGNTTAVTDANGGTTAFTYDRLDRLTGEISPSGKVTAYAYDVDGNLTASTDPNGNTILYAYDAVDRPVNKEYPDRTSVSFTHDALGRRISMTDVQGLTTYAYDALGRLLSAEGPEAGRTVQYTYDAIGNRVAMTDQGGNVTAYSYDALNRQVGITDAFGTTAYVYDPLSEITSIHYPNGASINYIYDKMNRPLTVSNIGAGGTAIASFNYTYNKAGMVTRKDNEDGDYTIYRYDKLDRLVREKKFTVNKKGNATFVYRYLYAYDALGNRTAFTKATNLKRFWKEDAGQMPQKVLDDLMAAGYNTPTPGGEENVKLDLMKTYRYDEDNRLLSWGQAIEVDTSLFPVENASYDYDENGNRLQEQRLRTAEPEPTTTIYGYDYENRLTSLEYVNRPNAENIVHAAFEYDGNGLRTKAQEGDKITQYYYDGRNVGLETDGQGVTQKSYVRALGFPGGVGGLVAQRSLQEELVGRGKNKKIVLIDKNDYYHYDALGSVVGLSEQGGYEVGRYDYDAFGNPILLSDGIGNCFLFSTKEYEDHAGLYFFGARYYDPLSGRWLTPDPMGFSDGPNVYTYVHNNPANLVDPFGYDAIVLNAPRGAVIAGHQAIAIGNDQTGWDYYSREGFKAPNAHEKYGSLEAMMGSRNGFLSKRYFNRFRIKTTLDQDQQMREYADNHINDSYNLLFNNCGDLVTGALQSGRIKTGYRPIGNWPNIAYQNIIKANKKE